jgi:hypothetical protein
LWRDSSAEIAFAYLEDRSQWRPAEAVTLDHLDLDGLVSLFALVAPRAALARRELLSDVALAGDFDLVRGPEVARVAFALGAVCDPARSPFGAGPGRPVADPTAWTARCAEGVLARMAGLCDGDPELSGLGAEEQGRWLASLRAVEHGHASIEEHRQAALAVVRLGRPLPGCAGAVGDGRVPIGVHPAAVRAVTAMPRVLVLEPGRRTFYDRYETWVRYVSAALPCRVDLQPLALALTGEERGGAVWEADPPGRTRPVLAVRGESRIGERELVERVCRHLLVAPPAWDPFATVPWKPGPPAGGSTALGEISAAAASRSGTSGRARARSAGRRRARP